MGRPAFAPSAEQRKEVEIMARYGIPEDDIALVLGIDAKTLRKHFRLELDVAFVKANAQGCRVDLPASGRRPGAILPAGHPDAGKLMRAEQPRVLGGRHLVGAHPRRALRVRAARPKPLGKKEAARLAAENAAQGTDWSELVDESRAN